MKRQSLFIEKDVPSHRLGYVLTGFRTESRKDAVCKHTDIQ